MNPNKTNHGELISSYACDYRTLDSEFALSKREYRFYTGKDERNNIIAYQVRQSFKPGEVTPEEANQIGYDFASRFLKGKHAFVVCTHTDKAHIHNHIIWNSTTLDNRRKFRNFRDSSRAIARLSDLIVNFVATSPSARGKKSTFTGNEAHSRGHEVHREQRGFCPSAP